MSLLPLLVIMVVSTAFGQDLSLSLYRVPSVADDPELAREVPLRHRANASMMCYDTVDAGASGKVGRDHFRFRLDDKIDGGDGGGDQTADAVTVIPVPRFFRLWSYDAADVIVDARDVLAYHIEHVAMLARQLSNTAAAAAVASRRFNATLPTAELQLNSRTSVPDAAWLRIKQVPRWCGALLTDRHCSNQPDSMMLPHTLPRIGECVNVWLHNLLRYHLHYRLPDIRLNLTAVANNCLRPLLGHEQQRLVRCFDDKVGGGGGDGDDGALQTTEIALASSPFVLVSAASSSSCLPSSWLSLLTMLLWWLRETTAETQLGQVVS